MGMDKGLLVYHDKPQREYIFDLLNQYCSRVFTSCRPEQHVPASLNPLFDSQSVSGPLNGIMTAFSYHDTAWLIVAVDMPFVDPAALEALIDARETSKIATCFFNREIHQPDPLLALWESHARVPLENYVRAGGNSPREFLNMHPVNMINPPHDKVLVNVNHPGFKL
jgi:molybdopterin-guanine dinucleotide biosynthesis protein A